VGLGGGTSARLTGATVLCFPPQTRSVFKSPTPDRPATAVVSQPAVRERLFFLRSFPSADLAWRGGSRLTRRTRRFPLDNSSLGPCPYFVPEYLRSPPAEFT